MKGEEERGRGEGGIEGGPKTDLSICRCHQGHHNLS